MSSVREERKGRQERMEDPINFMCGGCKKVSPYNIVNKLQCPHCGYCKEEKRVEGVV